MFDIDYRKVRDFNRMIAVRLNVFGRKALGTQWSLAEGRVIVELGRAGECTATEVAAALGMDKGNLSRILARLGEKGLVERGSSPVDGRTQMLALTDAGRAAFEEVDRLSDEQARDMLNGLSDEEAAKVVDAMETVRVALARSSSSPVQIVDGERYVEDFAELVREYVSVEIGDRRGFDVSFQDPETEIVQLPGKYARPTGAMFVAEVDGVPAGCVAYRRVRDDACEMKRLYVRPAFRGRHVANELLHAFYDSARATGYHMVYLDTDASMTEAISLYQHLGFTPCEAYYNNPLPTARYFSVRI